MRAETHAMAGSTQPQLSKLREKLRQRERDGLRSHRELQLEKRGAPHLAHNATLVIEGDDRFCGIVISLQPLLDGLLVVIHAATGLPSLQESLGHGLGACVHIQQQCGLSNLRRVEIGSLGLHHPCLHLPSPTYMRPTQNAPS
jgi:hypothetical protein